MGTTGSKKRNEKNFDRNQKQKKPSNLTNVQQQQQQEEVISDEWVQQQFYLQHQHQHQNPNQQQQQSTIHQVEGKENQVKGKGKGIEEEKEEEAVTPKDQQITTATTKTTLTAESPAAIVIRKKANSTPSSSFFAAKSTPALASASETTQSQRLKQNSSTWSLNSLLGTRLNWSFSGGNSRSSFRHRNKSGRKSFNSLQSHRVESKHQYQERQSDYHHQQQQKQSTRQKQQLIEEQQKRSKTQWHKPITNAIFSSHFKESSHSIEKYQIEKLVAKGAFGIVFQVIDKQQEGSQANLPTTTAAIAATSSKKAIAESAVPVISPFSSQQKPLFKALKVLKKSKIISVNSVQQIKDEADIQKLCGHHPFIVQQFDLWQNRHNLFIISEYIPNGELFSRIKDFSIDLVRLYVAEIALALDFLHNAGIIYRDAKPENILLTDKYHIKLTDFGLSKWLKLGMTTKTLCGTFHYMAPEILRGEPYGHAVDWWSLGVIASQMLLKKGPDVRQFIQISLPPCFDNSANNKDTTDNIHISSDGFLQHNIKSHQISPKNVSESLNYFSDFLPPEIEHLPHEGKDVIKRLLVVEPKQRLHSVLALQRIALYKNFKIEAKYLLSISPLNIMAKDQITMGHDNSFDAGNFKDF